MKNPFLIKQPNSIESIVYFIPLIWLLCISEIAKIVDVNFGIFFFHVQVRSLMILLTLQPLGLPPHCS